MARSGGVLTVLTVPSGGLIAGQSACMHLDGWTWEDMCLKPGVGLHINWPQVAPIEAWWMRRAPVGPVAEPRAGAEGHSPGVRRRPGVSHGEAGARREERPSAGARRALGGHDPGARGQDAACSSTPTTSSRFRRPWPSPSRRHLQAGDRRRLRRAAVRRAAEEARRAGDRRRRASPAPATRRRLRRGLHAAGAAARGGREVLHRRRDRRRVRLAAVERAQPAVPRRHGGRLRPAGRRGAEGHHALPGADSGRGRSHRLARGRARTPR